MNLKTRDDTELKSNTSGIKTHNFKVKTSSHINIRKRDTAVFALRRGTSVIKNVGIGTAKTIGTASTNIMTDGLTDEHLSQDLAHQEMENLIRYSSPKTAANIYRFSKGSAKKIRGIAEEKYIEKHPRDISTRAAFSPLRTRRRLYDDAVKDKLSKAATTQTKRITAALNNSRLKSYVKLPVGYKAKSKMNKAGEKTKEALKKVGSVIKAITNMFVVIIRTGAAVLLPLIIVVAVVVIAIAGNNMDTTDGQVVLTPLSVSGSYNDSTFNVEISTTDEVLISFSASRAAYGFFYSVGSGSGGSGTALNGTFNEDGTMEITGVINGERVVIRGTYQGGVIEGYGLMGSSAAAAMDGEWINPFGDVSYTITSEFGQRVHPISGELRQHDGYDLVSDTGENSNIYAVAEGEVIFTGTYQGYGLCIIIAHDDGLQSLYGHLNEILIQRGNAVATGQLIGKEGNTGQSTGPHLHLEARMDGTPVDVLQYYPQLYDNSSAILIQ